MDIKQKIGIRIKTLREDKELSQKDIAYSADLDRSYLASVENGKRNISIINVEKIAHALNVSVKDLFDDNLFSDL